MANRHDAEQIDRIRRVGSAMKKAAPVEGNANVHTSGAPLCKNPVSGGTPKGAKKGS